MLFDTSVLIRYIRQYKPLPARLLLSVVAIAEVEVFASRSQWEFRKRQYVRNMREQFPVIELNESLIPAYVHVELYSQGKLKETPLPHGLTARNMGKNDLWLAATALYLEQELHTTDNDFDHLGPAGVRVVKHQP